MRNHEWNERLIRIMERAYIFSYKARLEGILPLEDDLETEKVKQRDIFEYGMRFVVDGTRAELVDKILTNLIELEPDADEKLLKQIQKEAVLSIQAGENVYLMSQSLLSYVNNTTKAIVEEAISSVRLPLAGRVFYIDNKLKNHVGNIIRDGVNQFKNIEQSIQDTIDGLAKSNNWNALEQLMAESGFDKVFIDIVVKAKFSDWIVRFDIY